MRAVKKAESMKNEAAEFFKKGSYKEANEVYTKCLELFPNNPQYNSTIYLNRGISYSKLKLYEESLQDLNKAIELNEKYAKAFVKRAEIHQQLDQH